MTKFHEERAKIVDLLLMANFGTCIVFIYSVFMWLIVGKETKGLDLQMKPPRSFK